MSDELTVALPPGLVDAVAERVLELIEARGGIGPDDPWLTVDEAADYIKSSKQRVYDLFSQGLLVGGHDGRRRLVRRSELDRHLERGPVE